MAFPSPPERTFERLSCVVHERMQFSTVNISHSLSTVFDGSVYNPRDERRVLGDFEANWEKSCPETSDTSEYVVCDKSDKSVVSYLVLSGMSVVNSSVWHQLMGKFQLVSIPGSVEEICEKSFFQRESLSRVTFGESSSLKSIGKEAFSGSGVIEIHIPDGVEELCEGCFSQCRSLSRVTFGESSSLKLIGKEAFFRSGVYEIRIPDGVEAFTIARVFHVLHLAILLH